MFAPKVVSESAEQDSKASELSGIVGCIYDICMNMLNCGLGWDIEKGDDEE